MLLYCLSFVLFLISTSVHVYIVCSRAVVYICTCTCVTFVFVRYELPDYIMVMLVNKKTFHQITNDLKLFLGEHTTLFIDWLQEAVTSGNINTGKKKTTTTTGWIWL